MTYEEINEIYKTEHDRIEAEYFDIVIEEPNPANGEIGQHLELKPGKTMKEFQLYHSRNDFLQRMELEAIGRLKNDWTDFVAKIIEVDAELEKEVN